MSDGWTIVKVGGSLFDWPELGGRLRAWLDRLDARKVLLVPGGGAMADVVRALDQTHHLGEEVAHWLAIQALSVHARFLQALVAGAGLLVDLAASPGVRYSEPLGSQGFGVPHPWASHQICILDPSPFFQADEQNADHLPHAWTVTSDSLAVRAAVLLKARELILLKSTAWDGADWGAASRAGVVDGYFAEAMQQAPASLRVRLINLRTFS